jgi:hypothetical protein
MPHVRQISSTLHIPLSELDQVALYFTSWPQGSHQIGTGLAWRPRRPHSTRHAEVVLGSPLGLTVTAAVLHFYGVGLRVACAVALTSGSLGLALRFVGQQ